MRAGHDRDQLFAPDPEGILQLFGVEGDVVVRASARQPSMSEAGKGQGWLAR